MPPSGPHDGSLSVVNDRFAIEREAGRGGMGIVYKAVDLNTGQSVALKILRRGTQANRDRDRERFEREAQVLSTLRHPAIVSYVAHGQTPEGHHFLAMEWIDGEPLTDRLRHARMNIPEALTLLRLLASGLAEAHRLGIIHRDLKPSNILLRHGKLSGATILDFGIARGGILPVVTQTGIIVGTPEYMSPEQARGRRELTPASDVFSLGCLIFECLSGKPPFVAEQIAGVLAKILFDQAPALSTVLPEAPQALEELITAMLEKEPQDRIADAGSLVLRLAALQPMHDSAAIANTDMVARKDTKLTEAEQVLVGVIIANQPQIIPDQETLEMEASETESGQWKSVQNAIMQLGGRPEWLADGSLVVTLAGTQGGFATDLALQSGRCALLLKELVPQATVAMAMGRGQIAQQLPVGEGIDRALRLLRVAAPGTAVPRPGPATPTDDLVRIDSVSAGLLLGRADLTYRPDGSALLLGLQRQVDASRPLLGKATPCLGREQDLLGLERTLRGCIDESTASAVTITGYPGIGKSRLRHEFLRRLRTADLGVRVLLGSGEAQRFGASYGLLRQMLRGVFGIVDSDTAEERRQKLVGFPGLPWRTAQGSSLLPFIGELCAVPFPDDENPALRAARREPQMMSELVMRAFIEFTESLAARQPLLVIIDDLQWCDTLSIKLAEQALRALHDRQLMFLAFARPEVEERFPSLWGGLGQRIRLAGLSRKASERLVHHALGEQAAPDLVARIVNQADGNALFLEELIRAAASPSGAPQPDTVVAMLQSRVGRLPAFQRLLLRAAAIIGQTFWRGGLVSLLGTTAEHVDLDAELLALLDAEMIVRRTISRYAGEVEYSFRHALLRDAAYSMLTDSDRATGHRLAARYLATLADRSRANNTLRDAKPDPLMIAEHYRSGGDSEAAIPYVVQAAQDAFDAYDLAETQRLVDLGISLGAGGEHLGMLLSLQSWVAYWRGDTDRILEKGSDSISLLHRGSVWWCQTTGLLAASAMSIGRRADAKVLTQILLDTRPSNEILDTYLEALGRVLTTFSRRLERAWSLRMLQRIQQLLPLAQRRDGNGIAMALMAESLCMHDLDPNPYREAELLQDAVAIFQLTHAQRLLALGQLCLGEALCHRGSRDSGIAILRHAATRAVALGQPFLITSSQLHLADALVTGGEPHEVTEAESIAHTVEQQMHSVPQIDAIVRGRVLSILGRVALLRGEWDQAEAQSFAAIPLLENIPLRQISAQTTWVRALLSAGRLAEASVQADALLHQMEATGGAGCVEIPARLAIAEAFDADGDSAGARSVLDVALRLMHKAASGIPTPEGRERFIHEVPHNALAAELDLLWSKPPPLLRR
ncbi:MAG: protein kinase [Myxococcales bacterium]|nr:protein kinase [Myxococcales bacterium]